MSIQPGDTLPDTAIKMIDGDIQPVHTGALFRDRKAVLFGVPGAFTPTCSNRHLPGYVAAFDEYRARGITVMCLAVNDAYVMQAWAAAQHVPPGLLMLAVRGVRGRFRSSHLARAHRPGSPSQKCPTIAVIGRSLPALRRCLR